MTAMNAVQPTHFSEQIASRAFPYRFRKVGNPFTFLEDVGILPILEHIYKGNTILDVAREIDIPVTYLMQWVENNKYHQDIEDASRVSAEGFLSTAYDDLRKAETDFQLKKAKESLNHARFMASKLDKRTYGTDQQVQGGAAGVQYIFNIGSTNQAVDMASAVVSTQHADLPTYSPESAATLLAQPTPIDPVDATRDAAGEQLGPFVASTILDPDTLGPEALPDYLK